MLGAPRLEDYLLHVQAFRQWLRDDVPPARPTVLAQALPELPRIDWIDQDIAELAGRGLSPTPVAGMHRAGQGAVVPAPVTTTENLWGWCYVQEGSRLGGALLFRTFRSAFPDPAFRFLQGDGSVPAQRWRDFLALLDAELGTPAQVRQACEGAVAAFASLLQRFEQVAAR